MTWSDTKNRIDQLHLNIPGQFEDILAAVSGINAADLDADDQ